MCTGLKPFDDIDDNYKIGKMVCYDKITPLDYMTEVHPNESTIIRENKILKNLLKNCFEYDISKRLSSQEIYKLDFFQSYILEQLEIN